VLVGPNGAGKTSLLQLCTGYLHPTRGVVEILGHRLGRVDVRTLRERLALVSGSVTRLFRSEITALEAVLSGRHAALETWWHEYSSDDERRATELLAAGGLAEANDRAFGVLSEGERQQVLIARALMADAELLLFDEPSAGLDLAARERLVGRLADIATDPASPPIVFVTHHVEEIPPGFTHGLVLRAGAVVAAGPLTETLTSGVLTEAFGLGVEVDERDGRYTARAT
jgi:iron complex transport system ATP-binding protein